MMIRRFGRLKLVTTFCFIGLGMLVSGTEIRAQSNNEAKRLSETHPRIVAVYSVDSADLRGAMEISSLVNARRPYQDMKYRIQDRIRSIRSGLKDKQSELKLLEQQINHLGQDTKFDQLTVLRIDERVKLIKEEHFELLLQKEELIIQFSEIDYELQNLNRQIRKLRTELKIHRRI